MSDDMANQRGFQGGYFSAKKMAAGTVLPMPIAGTGSTAGVRGVEDPEGKRGFHEKAGTHNGIPADDL